MSQMMTQAECVDQMWDQHSSKVLKSVGILGDRMTLKQLSNHEFTCTQDKRDLLAGRLFAMTAEENLLQVEYSSKISRNKKVCETIDPVDSELLIHA